MAHSSKAKEFWIWFTAQEERLFAFKELDVRLAAEVSEQLAHVAEGLTFEFGPKGGEQRSFVISASGLYELMDPVIELCSSAPKLPRWNIVAFRQPKNVTDSHVTVNDKQVSLATVRCSLHRELRKVAVTLYFDEYSEDELESWSEIGFLLLDAVLGEHRVITEVGSVDFAYPTDAESEIELFSLSDLGTRFSNLAAEYRAELEGAAKRPLNERLDETRALIEAQDTQRWQAVSAEELDEDEELLIQYSFFSTDERTAASTADAMMELGHEEVSFEATHTLLGKGYLVIGSFGRLIKEPGDLQDLSKYLLDLAGKHSVELDGYALQRSAPFSEVDMIIVNVQQLLQLGRTVEAVNFCEQGLNMHGKHPELLALLAYANVKNGDSAQSIQVLEELYPHLTDDDSPPTLRWYAACAFALLEQFDEALRLLEQAIESNPEFIELARTEPDFERLREEPGFAKLVVN